ncbi:MAG: oligosaccharide flippase family protein [Verrucomicrobiota bacterium]
MEAVAEKPPQTASSRDAVKRGRFSVNLASNLGYLALSLAVGVWYVPFLVRQLGPAAYGLIPLASTLTSVMALITVGLNPAVGRSLTIALEQGNHEQASRVFNTAFWGSLALCAALLIPTGLGLVFLDSIIRVPAGLEAEARWLVAAVVAAFLLNELRTPFAVSAYCRNRFDLFNLVATGEILTRVGFVVLLFYALSASIQFVGIAILCGTLVAAAGSVWLWRRLTPSLRIAREDFNWGVFKGLATTGGWMIVNQVGWILYMGIDVLVANRLFGAELAGKYAAVMALPLLVRTLSANIGIVFQPTLTYYYARKDIDGVVTYARRGVKCLGLMLALPIALMCAFSEPLLRLWLGPAFGEWSPLLFLMAAPLCLNMAVNPLLGLHLTTDRMKVPGVFTLFVGLANLGLALLLAGPLGWGLYGIAAAGVITITLRHALFTPIYAAHILRRSWRTFLWEFTPILLVTVATILLGRAVASVWEMADWGDLIAAGLGISVLYCAGVLGLVLNQDERQMLWNAMRKR